MTRGGMREYGNEWRTGDPGIDDEHEKFGVLVDRLLAVARNTASDEVLMEALETLRIRMKLHASAEETYAARIDPATVDILREAHMELFLLLASVEGSIREVARADLIGMIAAFGAAIEQHEAEIDVPLFRLLVKR